MCELCLLHPYPGSGSRIRAQNFLKRTTYLLIWKYRYRIKYGIYTIKIIFAVRLITKLKGTVSWYGFGLWWHAWSLVSSRPKKGRRLVFKFFRCSMFLSISRGSFCFYSLTNDASDLPSSVLGPDPVGSASYCRIRVQGLPIRIRR